MIKIYRKTANIKAEQFYPENGVIPEGVFDKEYEHTTSGMISAMVDELENGHPSHNWHIKTLEGELKVNPGDWIATGVNGEHWPIADEVFKKTYAELPVIPKSVDYSIKKYKEWNCDLGIVFDDVCSGHVWEDGVGEWILENSNVFARAWLDGYVLKNHD